MENTRAAVNSIALTTNVAAFLELVERVTSRGSGLPGMACFYGPSGFGKTQAAIFAANEFRAYNVQMRSCYTRLHLCRVIAAEIGLDQRGTVATLVDRIGQELALTQRPLFIDEADFLVKSQMVEIIRDIHESSDAAVVLIGEELFPRKLEKWERVHGRMLDWVGAVPASETDAGLLAEVYCADVEIGAELWRKLVAQSGGSTRRLAVNLNMIREAAKRANVKQFDLAGWGQRDFHSGRAPHGRRAA